MKDKIKFGILGFGKMGLIRFNALNQLSNCVVDVVYEPNSHKTVPDGVERATKPEDVINRDDLSAILVCTPNYLIKNYTVKSLEAGKDVFAEKPPGTSLNETREMATVVKKTGRRLMFGFNHRHHDSVIYVKDLVESGQYGKILWLRGRYGKSVAPDFYSDWRSKRNYAGGGIFLDQGIHMLDLFMLLCGQFEEVKAFVSNLYWKGDIEDNVFAILRKKTGEVASLHSTMTQWRHLFSLEIFLEHGYMVMNGINTSSGTYGEETLSIAKNRTAAPTATWTEEQRRSYRIDNSWERELSTFAEAIRGQREITTCGIDDAVRLMEMVEKVYQDGA